MSQIKKGILWFLILVTFLKTKIACFEDQRRLFKRSRGFSKGRFFINQSLALFNFILHLFTNIKLSRTLFNFSITPLLFNAHFYSIKKKDQPHDQDQTHSHFKLLCNPSITIYIYLKRLQSNKRDWECMWVWGLGWLVLWGFIIEFDIEFKVFYF